MPKGPIRRSVVPYWLVVTLHQLAVLGAFVGCQAGLKGGLPLVAQACWLGAHAIVTGLVAFLLVSHRASFLASLKEFDPEQLIHDAKMMATLRQPPRVAVREMDSLQALVLELLHTSSVQESAPSVVGVSAPNMHRMTPMAHSTASPHRAPSVVSGAA